MPAVIAMSLALAGPAAANFAPAGTSGHALTAVTTQVWHMDANHYVTCTAASATMTVSATGATLSGVHTYSSPPNTTCSLQAGGTHPATVTTPNVISYSGGASTGSADTGGSQTFQYGPCMITLPRFTNLSMSYSNSGANLLIASTATGLPYSSNTACQPLGILPTGSAMSFSGTVQVVGVNAF
jgi:hypothetical protein